MPSKNILNTLPIGLYSYSSCHSCQMFFFMVNCILKQNVNFTEKTFLEERHEICLFHKKKLIVIYTFDKKKECSKKCTLLNSQIDI